ncbi:hypothetical protein [Acidithiobacillus sp.]|uniref:hypothetical protein n=1 Tax=Acidithiobacillus sp. TaxID=1872118 RepID=UPI0025C48CC6|nr:hypothetical protein [Acidithiobacillus sp.]
MLCFLTARRRVLTFFLIWIFALQASVARAEWYVSQVNRAPAQQTLFWVPSDDLSTLQFNPKGGVCVAPANRQALGAENDLDCVRQTLEEIQRNGQPSLAQMERLLSATKKSGFWEGFGEGLGASAGDLFRSILELPKLITEIPRLLQGLKDHPEQMLAILKKALLKSAETVVAYICEPSDANARALGKLVGKTDGDLALMVFGSFVGIGGKIGKGGKTLESLERAAKALPKIPEGARHIVAIRGSTLAAFQEAFNLHKKANVVSYISYTTRDGQSHLLRVVPKNLKGEKNSQLVVERADGGPVPFSVAEDVFKEIAGVEELPTPMVQADKPGYIVGDKPTIYVAGPRGRKVSLRNFASTTEASGPVWTVGIKGLGKNGLEEIKFKG